MTTSIARLPRPSWGRIVPFALVLCGFMAALAVGLSVGYPAPSTVSLAVLVCVALILALVFKRPFAAYLGIAASVVMLVVLELSSGRGLNLLDLLLLPATLAGFFGSARRDALAGDAAESGECHDAIRGAQKRLSRAAAVYFGLAALSIVRMFFDGRAGAGTNSLFSLVRAAQGLLLFPLGLWFLRSERRIRHTITAMCGATLLLLAVNIPYKLLLGVKRAGMTWFVNQPDWPIADPNEGAAAMLIIVALLVVLRKTRPHWGQLILTCAAFVMLVMTSSRSGLLAFIVFGALLLPRARWGPVLATGILLALALPLVPHDYWERMRHTLLMQRGTSDTFSSMIRFIAWGTAANAFVHNPLLGVGYLGLLSVSSAYNDLGLRTVAESYALEIAADLGIPGLIALGVVITRLFQLGHAVRRVAPPGSIGHQMATLIAPLLIGILVANLTASSLVGMVGVAQLALWSVMMTRAGHEALKGGSRAPALTSRAAPG